MKHRKISIKLTDREFLLLNTYQLHLLEEYGERKTKQQIIMELLLPVLRVTDECNTLGGAE
jgi:hypothetical protein